MISEDILSLINELLAPLPLDATRIPTNKKDLMSLANHPEKLKIIAKLEAAKDKNYMKNKNLQMGLNRSNIQLNRNSNFKRWEQQSGINI